MVSSVSAKGGGQRYSNSTGVAPPFEVNTGIGSMCPLLAWNSFTVSLKDEKPLPSVMSTAISFWRKPSTSSSESFRADSSWR